MYRCDALKTDGFTVFLGGIALVALPVVAWIDQGLFVHVVVAVGLGQYACGGNRQVFAIAFDNGFLGQLSIWLEAVAVDDDRLGAQGE